MWGRQSGTWRKVNEEEAAALYCKALLRLPPQLDFLVIFIKASVLTVLASDQVLTQGFTSLEV